MAKKITWQEKLYSSKSPVVKVLDKNFAGMSAGQKMLVPTAALIDDFIQKIPEGKSMDIATMRQALAKEQNAEVTCPVATGFAMRTVVEAAFEKFNQCFSYAEVTPVWRVLDVDSPTLKKVSFDPQFVLSQRVAEGIV